MNIGQSYLGIHADVRIDFCLAAVKGGAQCSIQHMLGRLARKPTGMELDVGAARGVEQVLRQDWNDSIRVTIKNAQDEAHINAA